MRLRLAAAALALSAIGQPVMAMGPTITMHQDPNCGCCTGWAQHMRAHGFNVEVVMAQDLAQVKADHNVPMRLASCHTARVHETGQVIEGHVPASAVRKMLLDTSIEGVAAPGMPANSPGMGPMDGNLLTVDFEGRPFSRD
jgi:Predicted metal-binding protein